MTSNNISTGRVTKYRMPQLFTIAECDINIKITVPLSPLKPWPAAISCSLHLVAVLW